MYDDIMQYEASYTDAAGTWISSMQYNELHFQEKDSNVCKWIGSFDESENFRLHGEAICVDGIIYFSPMKAENLDYYDIRSGRFGKVFLDKEQTHYLYATHIIQYKQSIYWPDRFSNFTLYEYDLEKKEIYTYSTQNTLLNYPGIGMDMILVEDTFYFVSSISNHIICFNAKKKCFDTILIESHNSKFNTICYDGENFWLSGDYCIVKYNSIEKKCIEYTQYPEGFGMIYRTNDLKIEKIDGFHNSLNEFPFSGSIVSRQDIFFFPHRTNMVIYVNTDDNKLKAIQLEPETEETLTREVRGTHSRFIGIKKHSEKSVFCYSTRTLTPCILDCINKKIESKTAVLGLSAIWKMQLKNETPFFIEKDEKTLLDFIEFTKIFKHKVTDIAVKSGEKIYSKLNKSNEK